MLGRLQSKNSETATTMKTDCTEAELRKHLAATIYAPNPAESMKALEASIRSKRRGWYCTSKEHLHRTLAFGYGRLGSPEEDELHMAQAEWIATSAGWSRSCELGT